MTMTSIFNMQNVRLWSGLVLFTYLLLHFGTHATGIWSFDLMRDMIGYTTQIWRSWPGTILLYGALIAHGVAGLLPLARRRTLRMSSGEATQIVLGLAIPFLMMVHVMGTRWASAQYGIKDDYVHVLINNFVFSPVVGIATGLGIFVAWTHGILGLYFWARVKDWYGPVLQNVGLVFAALWPTLAMASYLASGQGVQERARDDAFVSRYEFGRGGVADYGEMMSRDIYLGFAIGIVIVLAVLGWRLVRRVMERRRDTVRVDYLEGPKVRQQIGASLLEISRTNDVPHASVCGGRGRCSTCRVRVLRADPPLPHPDALEQRVLSRLGDNEDVRLACQLRPTGFLRVARLLPPDASPAQTLSGQDAETGQERTVTIMFADLRSFTTAAEHRLPFDVVYLINQFSVAMGETIERHGGYVDKFLGDGVMAIFGTSGEPGVAARQALAAAHDMCVALNALNERLAGDLDEPLRMGIGLHSGPAVLGDMGYGSARRLTAIGDTVNIAARLEDATKEQTCIACISDATAQLAQVKLPAHLARTIALRGRHGSLAIHAVTDPVVLTQRSLEMT